MQVLDQSRRSEDKPKQFQVTLQHSIQNRPYLPGLQSVSNEQTERRTFEIVRAGLQLSLRMSKQITPWNENK